MLVLEAALSEWGLDHVYIFKNWTWEQLTRYLDAAIERREKMAEAMSGKEKPKKVGFREFIAMMGGKVGKAFRKKEDE